MTCWVLPAIGREGGRGRSLLEKQKDSGLAMTRDSEQLPTQAEAPAKTDPMK